MSTTQISRLPGRLGDPESSLASDPRSDPRMIAALAPFGLDQLTKRPPVSPTDPLEAQLAFCLAAEAGFEGLFAVLTKDLPEIRNVVRTTETIVGVDGNAITLHIHTPSGATGAVPGILHIHGGGMTILQAKNAIYTRWRDELAATGLVVVGVEFRNAAGAQGPHPFPAGLNDCTSALKWVGENRARLGISKIVLQGESGGGNLVLATAIKAKRDGHVKLISGVYASVPYVSGQYEWDTANSPAELPSLIENDGYFIDSPLCSVMRGLYDTDRANKDNPLAWPLTATTDDLRGLPPHAITVNELDPCRDEGLAYRRKLVAAGVPVAGRIALGICHFADQMLQAALPDIHASALGDVRSFALSL